MQARAGRGVRIPRRDGDHGTPAGRQISARLPADLRFAPDRGVGRLTVREWVICMLMRIMEPAWLWPVLVAVGLMAEGEDRCLDAVLQAEFGEDAADVGLDGLLADRQVPGDLPVAVTAGDQPQHVAFAW